MLVRPLTHVIENLLELELGASELASSIASHFGDEGVVVPIDLLIKKPFRLTRNFEFLVAAGPEVVQVTGAKGGTYFGGGLGLDFMFWPTRRFGLWVEPEYAFVFRAGVSHGLGSTGGLLVGW